VIQYMQQNPGLKTEEVLNRFRDQLPNTSVSTVRNWRNTKPHALKKMKNSTSTRIRVPIGKFRTIEKELEKARKKRVRESRDRSTKFLLSQTRRLVNDTKIIKKLKPGERKMINMFKGTRSWLRKVIKRNCMKMKKIQSTASLSKPEFLVERKKYLKTERLFVQKVGLFKLNKFGTMKFDTTRLFNADETPLVLGAYNKRLKQVSAEGETTMVKPPPIVGSKKHRDATIVPFIGFKKPLFFCVIVFGSESIRRKEIQPLQDSFPNLLVWCNPKAYMLSVVYYLL